MNWYNQPEYDFYWSNYHQFYNQNSRTKEFLENYNTVFNASKHAHLETIKTLSHSNDVSYEIPKNFGKTEEKDSSFEFELDPDLIKFYEETLKFKRKRDSNKKKPFGEKDYKKGEQVNLKSQASSSSAPFERVGLKREEELDILYGIKAKEIHLLETNLQMKHDKNYDLYEPKYWPSFPLRIKFN